MTTTMTTIRRAHSYSDLSQIHLYIIIHKKYYIYTYTFQMEMDDKEIWDLYQQQQIKTWKFQIKQYILYIN